MHRLTLRQARMPLASGCLQLTVGDVAAKCCSTTGGSGGGLALAPFAAPAPARAPAPETPGEPRSRAFCSEIAGFCPLLSSVMVLASLHNPVQRGEIQMHACPAQELWPKLAGTASKASLTHSIHSAMPSDCSTPQPSSSVQGRGAGAPVCPSTRLCF